MKKTLIIIFALIFMASACNKSGVRHEKTLRIRTGELFVQLADTPLKREAGLSGVSGMATDEGMLFLFSEPKRPGFWMKDMKFGIDFIWINGNRVVGISENALPEKNRSDSELTTYSPPVDADKVLEVNSGWTIRHSVLVGDIVEGLTP